MSGRKWIGVIVALSTCMITRICAAQAISGTYDVNYYGDPKVDTTWNNLGFTSNSSFNAVTSNGAPSFQYNGPYKMLGVLLNDPYTLLDPTPTSSTFNGGQWEVFFQAAPGATAYGASPTDFGGTEAYMTQNGGNITAVPADSYSASAFTSELARVSSDDTTGQALHAGELIEVDANIGLYYKGQYNINEAHSSSTNNNFYIKVLNANYGMPTAQITPLSTYENASSSQYFDPTRATGGEHYEGDWIEIPNVELAPGSVSASNPWTENGSYTIQDSTGRTFTLQLGNGNFGNTAPTGFFNVYGIENQVSTDIGTNGYFISAPQLSDIISVPEPSVDVIVAGAVGALLLGRQQRKARVP
jgi:hypothetical protein